MYHAIDPQPSNARAWLAAASEVQRLGGDAHNVVIDIADPLAADDVDTAIMNQVNQFLRTHNVNTLSGVANTIFPLSIFERHGPEDFYGVYRKEVFPRCCQSKANASPQDAVRLGRAGAQLAMICHSASAAERRSL